MPADAVASMSTGLPMLAAPERNPRNPVIVAGSNGGTARPNPSQASAARIPGPPALVRIATRLPEGSG